MKRRSFLAYMSAAFAVPALPKPILAAPVAAPMTIPRAYPYGLAVFHARTRSNVTVEYLVRNVGVSPAKAEEMIARMLSENHIVASSSAGTYRAADPYRQNPTVRTRATSQSRARSNQHRTARANPSMMVYLRDMAHNYFAKQGAIA